MPAPSLSPYRTTGAGRRRRLAPLAVTVGLLIVGAVAASALTGSGIGAGRLGSGELGIGTGDDADDSYDSGDSDGTESGSDDTGSYGYDAETHDSSDGTGTGTGSTPPVSEDTTFSSPADEYDGYGGYDGYVVLPYADAWAQGVENTFNAYFEGINNGDAQLAWMQLSPTWQQQTTLDDFAEAVRTSHDTDFVVQEARYAGGRADVWLEFTSTQDPALGPDPGEACTRWSLDYVLLEQADGTFLIDEVAGHGGTTGHSAC